MVDLWNFNWLKAKNDLSIKALSKYTQNSFTQLIVRYVMLNAEWNVHYICICIHYGNVQQLVVKSIYNGICKNEEDVKHFNSTDLINGRMNQKESKKK